MELLHWLEVMTLDEIYRRSFVPQKPVVKLAKGMVSLDDVIKSHLGLSGPLTMRELQPALEVAASRKTLPVFVSPFTAETLLENDSIALAAEKYADKHRGNSHAVVLNQLQNLVNSGDIFSDPQGKIIEFCLNAAIRSDTGSYFAHESSLSYTKECLPSESRPFVIWTADLLAPVIYERILIEYHLKVEEGSKNGGFKAWFGVGLNKIYEAVQAIHPDLKKISKAKIKQAITTLVHLDLVYEVDTDEFQPMRSIPEEVLSQI